MSLNPRNRAEAEAMYRHAERFVKGIKGEHMSYARFGPDSDVYVFFNTSGVMECCACSLQHGDTWTCATAAKMLDHLRHHQHAGHKVPPSAMMRLAADAQEARIEHCHEEVACPYCLARVGERCRSMQKPGRTPPVLVKHPHRERWTLVVPAR